MPQPAIFALVLALSALISITAMIWLMLNARAVARLFAGPRSEMVPGPSASAAEERRSSYRPLASPGRVWAAILLFNLGWIGAVLAWSLAADVADNGPPPGTPAPSMERAPPAEP